MFDPFYAPLYLIITPPTQSTQLPQSSTITFSKVASMTLANNSTITRLVVDIPHFIHTTIE